MVTRFTVTLIFKRSLFRSKREGKKKMEKEDQESGNTML
jgi:hypothetical protein